MGFLAKDVLYRRVDLPATMLRERQCYIARGGTPELMEALLVAYPWPLLTKKRVASNLIEWVAFAPSLARVARAIPDVTAMLATDDWFFDTVEVTAARKETEDREGLPEAGQPRIGERHGFLRLAAAMPEHAALVRLVLERHPELWEQPRWLFYAVQRKGSLELIRWMVTVRPTLGSLLEDEEDDRELWSIACRSVREPLVRALHLFARFKVHARPLHASLTCVVVLAHDLAAHDDDTGGGGGTGGGAEEAPLVALKFMRDAHGAAREVEARMGLDAAHIVHLERAYLHDERAAGDGAADAGAAACERALSALGVPCLVMADLAEQVRVAAPGGLALEECAAVLVMPAADRNLTDAMYHDLTGGTSADVRTERVRQISVDVARALAHLHEHGCVHGDLKPLNIVRVGEQWRLIDLDVSTHTGAAYGDKAPSAGYASPEVAARVAAGGVGWRLVGDQEEEAVCAAPSHDVWSLGAVAFELCAGTSLFNVNRKLNDSLDARQLAELESWGAHAALGAVERLREGLDGAPRSTIDAAADFVLWLLEQDPTRRPSVAQVLSHRFLDPVGGSLREMRLLDDIVCGMGGGPGQPRVFISYAWANAAGLTRSVITEGDSGGTASVFAPQQIAWGPGVYQLVADIAPVCGSVWLDRLVLHGGVQLEAQFQAGITSADVVIACVSAEYVRSANCAKEMRLAHEHQIPVLPLMLGEMNFGAARGPYAWPPSVIGPEGRSLEQYRPAQRLFSNAAGDADTLFKFAAPEEYPGKLAELKDALAHVRLRHNSGAADDTPFPAPTRMESLP